jgi:hypothetical protein
MAQWFPIYHSGEAPFQISGARSGIIAAEAVLTITIDTYPELVYGIRFDTSYELPPAIFGQAPAFKQQMREGGVDDDYDVTIKLSQQSVATTRAHVRNVQGALGVNRHPWPVPYPLRGSNKIEITARRNSSYPELRVGETITLVLPVLKVTIEAARGVQQIADNITGPPAPGSTGFSQ